MSQSTKSDRFNLSRIAIENPAITVYLFIVLLLAGAVAYFNLGQDEDPPFTFRIMVVRAFWPGATAMQMAEQVSYPIEKKLREVPHIERIRSYSKPGETTLFLEIKDSAPPKEIPNSWYTTRKKINDMRYLLPQGVNAIVFNDEFGDVFGVIYALEAEGYSPKEVYDQTELLRQQFLRVSGVAKVDIIGLQNEKVYVEISQRKLIPLGISVRDIVNIINDQNTLQTAGEIKTKNDNIQVRLNGQFSAIRDLKNMPLHFNNRTFKLGDIAEIKREYETPPSPKVHYQGKDVVAIAISMSKGGNIIQLGKNLKTAVSSIDKSLPAGFTLTQIQNQPEAVAISVKEFLRVLIEALVIVLGVSFLSLGLQRNPWRIDMRPGLVVALSIPTVLGATFLVMQQTHIDLHKISLGSLIIALGLLVDDAIIITEMTVRKLEEGYDRLTASTYAFSATAMPMLTGTLITAAGFLPIGLANSAVGEYTFAIFAVTISALLISWLVSVYFIPYLGFKLLRSDYASKGHHDVYDQPFYRAVKRIVERCVYYRKTTIVITFLLMGVGIVCMQFVEKQFFPSSNRPEIILDLWSPEGSSFASSENTATRVESFLMKQKGVDNVTSFIGSGVPHFYLPMEQIFPQNNVSQLIVIPKTHEDRERLRKKLPELMAQNFPEVRVRVQLLPNGPPVTYPVMFRVLGPNPKEVRMIADKAKAILIADSNMRGVNDNWNEEIKSMHLNIDNARAYALGVTQQAINDSSTTLLSGITIGQYRESNHLLPIVLRQPENERNTFSAVANSYVPSISGKYIPISHLAKPELRWEPGIVWRQNGDFAITVQGDVREGIQGPTVSLALDKKLESLRQSLTPDYKIELAGTVAESKKGTSSISAKVPLMLFIIFTLLMLQLRSFSRSLLVFITGPLGIIGASLTLLVLQQPMGFVATLGIIALNGMIIRNSVILIDQIEQDIAEGIDAWDAIINSVIRRFRPIMLTAAAAVLAMIPLIHSTFWGPMAVAIMGGLIVATGLTLLTLPALYAAWFKVKPKL